MSEIFSLQKTELLITVASWEDRFAAGVKIIFGHIAPSLILMFYYEEYAEWSLPNRLEIVNSCRSDTCRVEDVKLSYKKPLDSWRSLEARLNMELSGVLNVTLDITTMPREAIWSICYMLEKKGISIQYVYFKPEDNGYGEWLSRDPGRPRILYRQAGIQHLGRQTALVVQTGYDVERVKQLVRYYEPEKVFLGVQVGSQLGNIESNRAKHEEAFRRYREIEMFDLDGYLLMDATLQLVRIVSPLVDKYNVILSSLGPKIGSLAIYIVKQAYSEVALAYAPSNEYNRLYSKGIGCSISGMVSEVSDILKERDS